MGWLRRKAYAALALALVPALVIAPPRAVAETPVLTVTHNAGESKTVSGNGGSVIVEVHCFDGKVPLAGYVQTSAAEDVRRGWEEYVGNRYRAEVISFASGPLQAWAAALCVPADQLGPLETVTRTFGAESDHVAEGTVPCPLGYRAVNASVRELAPERTLLTSTPTADLTGWSARGWVGDPDNPHQVLEIAVHCVDADRVPGWRVVTNLDPVGWGAPATATCPAGLQPVTGGTSHVGGDRGAITVHQRPTATGWSSTTLSLDEGSMMTTVVCAPASYPTIELSGSSGVTTSTTASWTFGGTDPSAGGGYALGFVCSLGEAFTGVGEGPSACTSPFTRSDLSDGHYVFRVRARTSDDRWSLVAERRVSIDTTPPAVTLTQPPLINAATSATVTWSGRDPVPDTGLAGYELRRRRTGLTGPIGTWTNPVALGPLATSRTFTSLVPGSTYCYGVRATDLAGNTGPWATRCTVVPVDDRTLARSAGWGLLDIEGWYGGTALTTRSEGASLSMGATTRRAGLVALTCPTCGSVAVLVGGVQVGTIDLAATTTARRTIALPPYVETTGPVVVKVLSTGKLVRVDALALGR